MILLATDRGHSIEIEFDQSHPESAIRWREVGDEDWQATPHQSADAGMDAEHACELVLDYLSTAPA